MILSAVKGSPQISAAVSRSSATNAMIPFLFIAALLWPCHGDSCAAANGAFDLQAASMSLCDHLAQGKAKTSTTEAGRVGDRPYARGRAYKADRYDD